MPKEFQEIPTSIDPGKISAEEIKEAQKIKDIAMKLKSDSPGNPPINPTAENNPITQQTY